jgi:hypothetical protein
MFKLDEFKLVFSRLGTLNVFLAYNKFNSDKFIGFNPILSQKASVSTCMVSNGAYVHIRVCDTQRDMYTCVFMSLK